MRPSLPTLLLCTLALQFLAPVVPVEAQEKFPPQCTADTLDIKLRTEPQSAQKAIIHALAVEFQNRTERTCSMTPVAIKFPPGTVPEIGDSWLPDSSTTAEAFQQKSFQLDSGEIVHFLLAWSSQPITVSGIAVDDCAIHDRMTLSPDVNGDPKPFFDVHHLWMKSCGNFYRSAYRLGRYVPGEPIPKEWFERHQLDPSDYKAQVAADPEKSSTDAQLITLRALSDIEYLKSSFESGYSGYFELFLKEPSSVFPNCPFEALRKREADGETLIFLNHCRESGEEKPTAVPRETRLLIREMGMLPERPGRIEYDVIGEVLPNGGSNTIPVRAHSQLELSVHDANQPMLPAIDTQLLRCRASQLKLLPPDELGSHWREPRAYPPGGEEWHDGKVFVLTNISDQICLLGGTPQLRGRKSALAHGEPAATMAIP